jgi:hypothetical protein
MTSTPPKDIEELLRRSYDAFNSRNIDAAIALMQPDVNWPNMIQGTRARCHDEVRAYWKRQFEVIDTHVDPEKMTMQDDGRIVVDVHQVVKQLDGSVRDDRMVQHVYTIRDGLVERMDVQQP